MFPGDVMNRQSNSSQEFPFPIYVPRKTEGEEKQLTPEVELWEPPFERWLRLADDLLRDWPGTHAA